MLSAMPLALPDPAALCRGGYPGRHHLDWVALQTARFVPERVLVRVTCSDCGGQFEHVHHGLLAGHAFPLPSHAPRRARYHGPAYFAELAGRVPEAS